MKVPQIWKFPLFKRLIANEITEERTYFALTLLTGIAAGVAAVFIHKSVYFLTHFFGTEEPFSLQAVLYSGAALMLSGIISTRFLSGPASTGIPGVRVALAVHHGRMTLWNTLSQFFSSILSLSAGISLGREGPTVAVASGIGSYLGNFFSMSKKRVKALVAVGATGGLAAAFHTPIAAVVFTLEEVVGDLNADILGSIIISSVVASVTAGALEGNEAIFSNMTYVIQDYRELLFYLGVGVACAFIGPLWISTILKLRQAKFFVFKHHKMVVIFLTFLFIAGLSHIAPEALGSGHQNVEQMLMELIEDWRIVLALLLFKFVATTISYASGVIGGLLIPTVVMGAMIGSLIGSGSEAFFPEITTNSSTYALVGMGAFFASVIRAPFTSILVVFEMTQDYNIMLPLMVANVSSYFISSKFSDGSIYEQVSEQDGVHLPTREDDVVLEVLSVEDAMVEDVVSLDAKETVISAIKRLRGSEISGYPVMKNGLLVGIISSNEIGQEYALGHKEKTIEELCNKRVISVYQDQSLLYAFNLLKKHNISRLPVVSRLNDKRLIGIITAENIVSHFGYHIQEENQKVLEDIKLDEPAKKESRSTSSQTSS